MDFRKSALEHMKKKMRGSDRSPELQSVEVMGDSPEALEEGLEVAQDVIKDPEAILGAEDMIESDEEELEDDIESEEESEFEEAMEDEAEEELDLTPEQAQMLIKKLQAKFGI